MIKSALFIAFCAILLASIAESATIRASSCSRTNVLNAINSANNGDTVEIPAGDCSYSSRIVITNKGIHIKGDGRSVLNLRPSGTNDAIFEFNCSSSTPPFEISGITVQGPNTHSNDNRGFDVRGRCIDFKIHDNTFRQLEHAGVYVRGRHRGVVYSNLFDEIYDNNNGIGYGSECIGDAAAEWARFPAGSLPPEDQEMVYYEDNVFIRVKHVVAGNNGCRYVARHNLVDEARSDAAPFDNHGLAAWPTGSRQFSIYNNVSTRSSGGHFAGVLIRGGDGVIYNNSFQNENDTIVLDNDGGCGGYPKPYQIRELHEWNNTNNGSPGNVRIRNCADLLQEGRDFFSRSSAPPLSVYTPFTYPHPLRGGGSGGGGGPPPPPPPGSGPIIAKSFVLRSDLQTIRVALNDPNGGISVPSASGFTLRIGGVVVAITAASCASTVTGSALCTLSHNALISSASQVVQVSYSQSTGNVLDGSNLELLSASNAPVTNWFDKVFNTDNLISTTANDPTRPVSALFDNDLTNEASSAIRNGLAPNNLVVEFDLINPTALINIKVAGDNLFSKQCETYRVEHKATLASTYNTLYSGEFCNQRTLLTRTFSETTNRYWKITFTDDRNGASTGCQVFELDGTVGSGSGPPPPPTPVDPSTEGALGPVLGLAVIGLELIGPVADTPPGSGGGGGGGTPLCVGTTVDDSGGKDHLTIQAGHDAAPSGGKVCVSPGNYFETVTISKPITIEAANPFLRPLIDCDNSRDFGIVATADVDNVVLRSLRISNCNERGIDLTNNGQTGWIIEKNYIDHIFARGISIEGEAIVQDNIIFAVGNDGESFGIFENGSGSIIRRNWIGLVGKSSIRIKGAGVLVDSNILVASQGRGGIDLNDSQNTDVFNNYFLYGLQAINPKHVSDGDPTCTGGQTVIAHNSTWLSMRGSYLINTPPEANCVTASNNIFAGAGAFFYRTINEGANLVIEGNRLASFGGRPALVYEGSHGDQATISACQANTPYCDNDTSGDPGYISPNTGNLETATALTSLTLSTSYGSQLGARGVTPPADAPSWSPIFLTEISCNKTNCHRAFDLIADGSVEWTPSASPDPQVVGDAGSSVVATHAILWNFQDGQTSNVNAFQIDGSTTPTGPWTQLISTSQSNGNEGNIHELNNAVPYRYYRLTLDTTHGASSYTFGELGLMTFSDPLNPIPEVAFHVAPAGNDSNSGLSLAQAWATIGKANATLQAGDKVLIHAGTYNERIRPVNSGTSDSARITYKAAGDGNVNLTNFSSVSGPGSGAIALGSRNFVTVSGRAEGDPVTSQRIRLVPSNDVEVLGEVCNSNGNIVENIFAQCPSDSQNCSRGFAFCVSYWSGSFETKNNILRNSHLIGNTSTNVNNANDFTEDIVTLTHNSHHNVIEGNTIEECNHSAIYADGPISHSNVIRDNTVRNTQHTALSVWSAGGALSDDARFLVENNRLFSTAETSTPTGGPGNAFQWGSGELIIRHNVIAKGGKTAGTGDALGGLAGATGASFGAGYEASDTRVYNNTIVKNNDDAVGVKAFGAGNVDLGRNRFHNNFLYDGDSHLQLVTYWDNAFSTDDRWVGNVFGSPGGSSGDNIIQTDKRGIVSLATAISTFSSPADPTFGAVDGFSNVYDASPGFTNYAGDDFTLTPSSSYVDAGSHLTKVAVADTSTGTSLILEDTRPFYGEVSGFPSWMGVQWDWIAVGPTFATAQLVQIAGVNDNTNTITLSTSISRSDGDFVWLWKDSDGTEVVIGTNPDIGYHEQ